MALFSHNGKRYEEGGAEQGRGQGDRPDPVECFSWYASPCLRRVAVRSLLHVEESGNIVQWRSDVLVSGQSQRMAHRYVVPSTSKAVKQLGRAALLAQLQQDSASIYAAPNIPSFEILAQSSRSKPLVVVYLFSPSPFSVRQRLSRFSPSALALFPLYPHYGFYILVWGYLSPSPRSREGIAF